MFSLKINTRTTLLLTRQDHMFSLKINTRTTLLLTRQDHMFSLKINTYSHNTGSITHPPARPTEQLPNIAKQNC
jgi:hypothetical protein